jgi:acyl-coenzyme A thioesterase PaaI-like protein
VSNPVAELRALAALLATRDVPPDTLDDVAARLAVILAELDAHPVRPRWYEVDPADRDASRAYHDQFGPVRGRDSVVAAPLVFDAPAEHEGHMAVVARARCGVLFEGPPRVVHGGIVAACFDEMLAVTQRDAGINGLTTELSVRYRRPIRIDTDLVFHAWIESDDGRRAVARAECRNADEHGGDGVVRAEAVATFTRPEPPPPDRPSM